MFQENPLSICIEPSFPSSPNVSQNFSYNASMEILFWNIITKQSKNNKKEKY